MGEHKNLTGVVMEEHLFIGDTGIHWDTGFIGTQLVFRLIIDQCDTCTMTSSQLISCLVNLEVPF